LAPGWWIALALVCMVIVGVFVWSALRRRTARYRALRELEAIAADDPVAFATTLSVLLRRLAILRDAKAGQLKGDGWAQFLADKGMTDAMAKHLANAPYAPANPEAPAPDALRDAARSWIRRHG